MRRLLCPGLCLRPFCRSNVILFFFSTVFSYHFSFSLLNSSIALLSRSTSASQPAFVQLVKHVSGHRKCYRVEQSSRYYACHGLFVPERFVWYVVIFLKLFYQSDPPPTAVANLSTLDVVLVTPRSSVTNFLLIIDVVTAPSVINPAL